jgi:ArsR family transcriptional regulator
MQLAAKTNSVDKMFRALADPTRLRILNLLRPGERCVCDLVRIIGVPQPNISQHLAYLRKAGLVTGRKDGLWMHYSLAPIKGEFHQKLIECLGCCFSDVPEMARDLTRLGKISGGNRSCSQ